MKTKYEWGKLVIKDKRMNKPQKENKSLKSVLETTEVDSLVEAAEIIEYDFTQNTSIKELTKMHAPETSIRIPQKPSGVLEKEEYKNEERKLFNMWKLSMNALLSKKGVITPYERNLNVWRQLWFTLENSDLIVQIVDARNPLLFYTEDVLRAAPSKKHFLLLNKSDLLTEKQKALWSAYFTEKGVSHAFYSTLQDSSDDLMQQWSGILGESARIGMIGYPNVGKSSTINSLFKKKVVKTSIIPGKTKNIQTLQLDEKIVCDCPGLVFPTFVAQKEDLLLNGILSLDQTRDIRDCLKVIVDRVGIRRMCYLTKVIEFVNDSRRPQEENFVHFLKKATGCMEEGKLLKMIIRQYIEGHIRYVHPVPGHDPEEFNRENHTVPDSYRIDEAVSYAWYQKQQEEKKKKEMRTKPEELMTSKKHYLKRGKEREFKVKR
ncbi:large subunit GTPase 1 [Nematocida major]|uniref:large subunit GTPase 1 n=1 Tax=Nematocida major TaxID=1912982 RepID=UPI0020081B07|nr:large subunit GTPase 1 [Nematocida major]KAH9386753.1 large subunit GTPase 1 [Nematocida major]